MILLGIKIANILEPFLSGVVVLSPDRKPSELAVGNYFLQFQ